MQKAKELWDSAAVLVVAIIAITCFVRGKAQLWLFLAAFMVWGVRVAIVFLVPAVRASYYRREGRKIERRISKNQEFTFPDTTVPPNHTILCHVNHRITGAIKSLYPDATWKWKTEKPEQIMAKGGTGRIELFGADEYNFADVSFDEQANIKFSFLKVVNLNQMLKTAVGTEEKSPVPNETDPQVWFERKGRVILKNLIADLASRGHHRLKILDDGSCVIEQGEKTVWVSRLDGFPKRVYYPRLIKVLEGEGIASETVDGGLALNW